MYICQNRLMQSDVSDVHAWVLRFPGICQGHPVFVCIQLLLPPKLGNNTTN